jgi:tripartite-type tricarboxylate transporter receptor subunit TctC
MHTSWKLEFRLDAVTAFAAAAMLLSWVASVSNARAQAYPARPVRVVVSVAPGGGTDTVARMLGQHLTERFGQPFVIDNRPGGGGAIAVDLTARAAPDGHTLLFSSSTFVINQLLYKVAYDTLRDLAPVSLATQNAYVLAVNATVPAKTLRDFVALAKTRPRGFNYASSGRGSLIHLTAELLGSAAGIEMVHVPYKGMALAFPDILSGQVHVAISSALTMLPHLRSGRVHALGVTGRARVAALPEVPTIAEQGFRGFEVTQWYGMMAPAGTPLRIRQTVQQEMARALQLPDVRGRLTAEGAEPVGNTPAEFAGRLKEELVKWRNTISAAGIKVR